IPEDQSEHAHVRVLVGRVWGMESPVTPVSETLYVDISLPAGGRFGMPPLASVRALYAVAGAYRLEGTRMEPYVMAVLPAGDTVRVEAETPARIMLIGGGPQDRPGLMVWDLGAADGEGLNGAASGSRADQLP